MSERTPIDRGIIFSPAMIYALLAGRKTQTRRLASSPLAKALPGDRFWVREAWKAPAIHDKTPPRDLDPATPIYFTADDRLWPVARYRPGMHMPRWASRLTLIVDDVRFEPVDQISEADAMAEGITRENIIIDSHCAGGRHNEVTADRYFSPHLLADDQDFSFAGDAFAALWDSLHTKEGERFEDSPPVVALTFRAIRGNIDRLAP